MAGRRTRPTAGDGTRASRCRGPGSASGLEAPDRAADVGQQLPAVVAPLGADAQHVGAARPSQHQPGVVELGPQAPDLVDHGDLGGDAGRDAVLVVGVGEQGIEVALGGGATRPALGLVHQQPGQVVAGGGVGVPEGRLGRAVGPGVALQGRGTAVLSDQDAGGGVVGGDAGPLLQLFAGEALALLVVVVVALLV